MNILIVEGNGSVRASLAKIISVYGYTVYEIRDTEDFIFELFYGRGQYDLIFIGDELDVKLRLEKEGIQEELHEELDDLNNNSMGYFPVTLGKVAKSTCRKLNKKVPNVIIYTTFSYYEFLGNRSKSLKEQIQEVIKKNNFEWLDKNSITFMDDLKQKLKSKL